MKATSILQYTVVYEGGYFPKGFSSSGNFPRVFSQVATCQMCNFPKWQLPESVLAAALAPPIAAYGASEGLT